MGPDGQRTTPQGSWTPWILGALTVCAVAAGAAWGFHAADGVGRSWAQTARVGRDPDRLRNVVGLFPAIIAILSTLTIIAWIKDRRRLKRRRLLLRRLNVATGMAAGVYADIDLLETGSPLSRDGKRDAFDVIEDQANGVLEEAEELRRLILSAGWREKNGKDSYLLQQVEGLVKRATAIERQSTTAAVPRSLRSSAPAPDPLGSDWADTVSAVADELDRTVQLLGNAPASDPVRYHRAETPDRALAARLRNAWENELNTLEVKGAPDALTQKAGTLAARRKATVDALGGISALLTKRLAILEMRGEVKDARTKARDVVEGQADAFLAPWGMLHGPTITPDAFASVAVSVLKVEQAQARPEVAPSEWESAWDSAFGKEGLLPSSFRVLGVRGTVFIILATGSALIGVGAVAAALIGNTVPWLTTPERLPYLGLGAGLLLSVIPWVVTAMVFATNDGGVLRLRQERAALRERLTRAQGQLSGVVAQWDGIMLTLVSTWKDGPESIAFTRRKDSLESSLLAALRTSNALDSVPAVEVTEPTFAADLGHFEKQVAQLSNWAKRHGGA